MGVLKRKDDFCSIIYFIMIYYLVVIFRKAYKLEINMNTNDGVNGRCKNIGGGR